MKKPSSQFINSAVIIIGGVLLIFEISGEERNVYVMIIGLVMLMFGLYRATNYWVETKDDHKKDEEGENNNSL
ncbi:MULTISPECIES: hypothetical protein [Salinimicrobium]|jgi:uncharacterized protein YxeA|uniref:Uncharacterized protein n=1 Tax=Salinimicrobium profundisediminis TaxID=2994553 RepID=A0A9X3CVC1_9FLAO|nr:hypothetical protein [Salinimicrobium profundisediminis]MCX2837295.1 hypothetical protein [Salinimicrobium profundisediminis]